MRPLPGRHPPSRPVSKPLNDPEHQYAEAGGRGRTSPLFRPGSSAGGRGGRGEEGEEAPRRPGFTAGSPLRSQLAGGQSRGLRIQRSFRLHQRSVQPRFPTCLLPRECSLTPPRPLVPRAGLWGCPPLPFSSTEMLLTVQLLRHLSPVSGHALPVRAPPARSLGSRAPSDCWAAASRPFSQHGLARRRRCARRAPCPPAPKAARAPQTRRGAWKTHLGTLASDPGSRVAECVSAAVRKADSGAPRAPGV